VIDVRPARPEEYTSAGHLTVEAYRAAGVLGGAEVGYEQTLLASARRASEAVLLVAVDDRELIGTVTYCTPDSPWAEISRGDEAEFRMLAVRAEAQGRGIGRRLIEACAERAYAEGRRALVLSALRENADAQLIYARMGFTRAPGRDWRPAPGVDLLVWSGELPLAPGTLRPPAPGDAARR
jgi:GNAT superfamily N-acetyltransferase